MKIQVNSSGKAYLTSNNKLLKADTDTITAVNNTGSNITSGSKVWVNNNELYDFNIKIKDFTVVGNPTLNDTLEIANNFTTNNYLQFKQPFNPESNPWEICLMFTTASSISARQNLFSSCVGTDFAGRFGYSAQLSSSRKLELSVSTDGTSWNSYIGSHTYALNTTYWLKIGWDGTKYYANYSTNGVTFTGDISQNNSNPLCSSMIASRVGVFYEGAVNYPWGGYIHLSNCYININGQRWWTPYMPAFNENTLTGIAQENISAGSSGSVKVMEI
jgi:hypothetical protein